MSPGGDSHWRDYGEGDGVSSGAVLPLEEFHGVLTPFP